MARILVVDDEDDIRFSIRKYLERAHYEVVEAANGIEADQRLGENSFDIVITDIIMPEKEGIALIIDINQKFPKLKVIAMTGGGSVKGMKSEIIKEGLLEDASIFGADETLRKPFKLATLLECVDNCLAKI